MNYLKIGLMALVSLFFVACNNNGTPPEPKPTLPANGAYAGTFVISQGTEDEFVWDANVVLTINQEETYATVDMLKVKFTEKGMPEMDITIPGVPLTEISDGYTLSCDEDGIIPIMAGGKFPDRVITEIVGKVTSQTISFSFVCMNLPVNFTGVREGALQR
ncbi:MAG: calycin-like domain-containing protein [Alistipes sp.]|jgi:hypothetical protein|nr:calycin-like domain-containing protein [Alistipes sp.]